MRKWMKLRASVASHQTVNELGLAEEAFLV